MNTGRERGSATLEAAIVVPATLLLVAVIIMAGRIALAHQAMGAVAFDTARAASLARNVAAAHSAANEVADHTLASNGLNCSSQSVHLDASGLNTTVGSVGTVNVTVTCTVALSDIAMPGMPQSVTLSASATSPVDPYRER